MRINNQIGYRPTWAEINLDNLCYNFREIKKRVSSRTKVLVTVKADAYGHGLIPVSRKLVACGVDFLGVASMDEGIRLREAGILTPILILGLILKKDIEPLLRFNLIPTVCELDFARDLNKKAGKQNRRVRVHIKVDTGMGRIGVAYHDALGLVGKIHRLRSINIEGLFTHFPLADINKDFTLYQVKLFRQLVQSLKAEGIRIPLVHAANSVGIIKYAESHFNMVRPGLIIYGLYPAEDIDIKVKPVLSLKTRVIFVKKISRALGISYGHDYIASCNTRVVTLPIGYGDGYPRNLSNTAPVLIRGRRFKISGRVCMDQFMVDVGGASVKTGDEAVLIGSQGKNNISVEELSVLAGTIPYEIVCGLGSRIPRVYVSKAGRL